MIQSALFLVLLASPAAAAPDAPPMPYLDWGACPFECCTYGPWKATKRTAVLVDRRADAPVEFELEAGELATVDDGVVVTLRPGRIRAKAAVTVGDPGNERKLAAGDVVYILHDEGEGVQRLWLEGEVFSAVLLFHRPEPIVRWDSLELLELPATERWVRVENQAGTVGWSPNPDDFVGSDACGAPLSDDEPEGGAAFIEQVLERGDR